MIKIDDMLEIRIVKKHDRGYEVVFFRIRNIFCNNVKYVFGSKFLIKILYVCFLATIVYFISINNIHRAAFVMSGE